MGNEAAIKMVARAAATNILIFLDADREHASKYDSFNQKVNFFKMIQQ